MSEKKIRRGPELYAVAFRASSYRCVIEAAHKAADFFSAFQTSFWVFALLNIYRV